MLGWFVHQFVLVLGVLFRSALRKGLVFLIAPLLIGLFVNKNGIRKIGNSLIKIIPNYRESK